MQYTQEKYLGMINSALEKYLYNVSDGQSIVKDAMNYSLFNGGKRIRPILVMEFCRICGGNPENALPFACAIEMIHTYSLIHDDLPCMDNDDMRRGKPSCHKAFGEEYALLAGDGLLTLAFETAAKSDNVSGEALRKAVNILAHFAGIDGMVGGQVIDLLSEKTRPSLEKLKIIDSLKTGALIKAACVLGCYASDNFDDKKINSALTYAADVGLAFQIVDDILDVTSDTATLGKPVGSDEKNEKITYVKLLGIEKSKEAVENLTDEAISVLNIFSEDTAFLSDFALKLAVRKK